MKSFIGHIFLIFALYLSFADCHNPYKNIRMYRWPGTVTQTTLSDNEDSVDSHGDLRGWNGAGIQHAGGVPHLSEFSEEKHPWGHVSQMPGFYPHQEQAMYYTGPYRPVFETEPLIRNSEHVVLSAEDSSMHVHAETPQDEENTQTLGATVDRIDNDKADTPQMIEHVDSQSDKGISDDDKVEKHPEVHNPDGQVVNQPETNVPSDEMSRPSEESNINTSHDENVHQHEVDKSNDELTRPESNDELVSHPDVDKPNDEMVNQSETEVAIEETEHNYPEVINSNDEMLGQTQNEENKPMDEMTSESEAEHPQVEIENEHEITSSNGNKPDQSEDSIPMDEMISESEADNPIVESEANHPNDEMPMPEEEPQIEVNDEHDNSNNTMDNESTENTQFNISESNPNENLEPGSSDLLKSCVSPRGQFPTWSSCKSYVNCWDGIVIEQECTNNLLFSADKGYCDFPENVNCGSRPMLVADTKPVTDCSEEYATFRSPTNCSEYFICLAHQPVKISCPDNLYYNTVLKVCDYPYRVYCDAVKPRVLETTFIPTNVIPETNLRVGRSLSRCHQMARMWPYRFRC